MELPFSSITTSSAYPEIYETACNAVTLDRSSISLILSHHKTDINFKAWNFILFKIKIDMIKCVTSDKRNKIFLSMEIE